MTSSTSNGKGSRNRSASAAFYRNFPSINWSKPQTAMTQDGSPKASVSLRRARLLTTVRLPNTVAPQSIH